MYHPRHWYIDGDAAAARNPVARHCAPERPRAQVQDVPNEDRRQDLRTVPEPERRVFRESVKLLLDSIDRAVAPTSSRRNA